MRLQEGTLVLSCTRQTFYVVHIMNTTTIKASLLGVTLVCTMTLGAIADDAKSAAPSEPLPVRIDNSLNAVFGAHSGARAVHAKGVVLVGSFTPSAEARSITKAAFLQQIKAVPVTVRFSNGSGVPTVADTDPSALPRGFAVKYHLPNGSDMDTLAQSINFFPVPTGEEFANLFRAIAASGPHAPKPTALDTYLGAHPIARAFLAYRTLPAESYATLAYFGINSFKFTNDRGDIHYGRYLFRPRAGAHYLPANATADLSPNYLVDEITRRVRNGPVSFDFYVQIAAGDDDIRNPSVAWPVTRRMVKMGTILIRSTVADSAAVQKTLLYLPTSVPEGIEPADPMIAIRTAEYGVSFSHRLTR